MPWSDQLLILGNNSAMATSMLRLSPSSMGIDPARAATAPDAVHSTLPIRRVTIAADD